MADDRESPAAWHRFSLLFLPAFLLCGSATLVFGRLPAAVRCRPTATPDTFVGECRGIGDYEHAAYVFALKPRAVAALGAAQAVMLGNSRAQFAFSSEASRRWFPARGVPAYRIGFGYDEGAPLALTVMGLAGTRPHLAIVNADTFFTERLSLPATRIRDEPWRAWVGALRSRTALDLRGDLRDGLARARLPGQAQRDPPRARRRGLGVAGQPRAAGWCGLDRCGTWSTAVPNSLVEAREATAALARDLRAHAILPRVAGLRTIDSSHLDAPSAEAWSTAFLAELEPILRACLRG